MKFYTITLLFCLIKLPCLFAQPCNLADASGCSCGTPGTFYCDLLPDIAISVDLLEDTENLNERPGWMDISVGTPNIGLGPLRVEPSNLFVCGLDTFQQTGTNPATCPDGSEPKILIKQRVYKKEGDVMTSYLRDAGAMTYHPSHSHMHVDDWGYYTIKREIPGTSHENWETIGEGVKLGFCLMDFGTCEYYYGHCRDENNAIITNDLPNYGLGGGNYSCGATNQGLSVGWTDIYFSDIPGMQIQLPPGTCNGEYKIVVEIDPLNHFLESNEDNNIVIADLFLNEQSEKRDEALDLQGSTILCKGETSVLSANYGNSFLWSTGETTQSINITAPGSYSCAIEVDCETIQSYSIEFTEEIIPMPEIGTTFICEPQAVTLNAQGNISWYSDASGNNLLASGNQFQTPIINSGTSYWFNEEVFINGSEYNVGLPDNYEGSTAINGSNYNGCLIFDVQTPFTLVSVKTFADAAGTRVFQILDRDDVVIHQKSVMINAGEDRAYLNFNLDLGINYKIKCEEHPGFYRNKNNVIFPYEIQGIVNIKDTNYGNTFYYYFYDWEIKLADRTCYSDLQEALIMFEDNQAGGEITGLPEISENTATIDLTAEPAGGVFSGDGINQNVLNTSTVNTGLNTITYTHNSNSNCETVADTSILIYKKSAAFSETNIHTIAE